MVGSLVVAALALGLTACSSVPGKPHIGSAKPPAGSHSTTTTTKPVVDAALGKVCGITAMGGGPAGGLHGPVPTVCPSGPKEQPARFKLLASTGKTYPVFNYDGGWAAELPPGTYRVVDAPFCPRAEDPFVVTAGKTLTGVVAWFGCTII